MQSTHRRRALALFLVTATGSFATGCSDTDALVPQEDIYVAAVPPPVINGGTLAIAPDGHTAIAADTDRDVVWIVDVDAAALKSKVALDAGDEPGRVVIDNGGRAHVILMASGAVATVDVASGKLADRRSVCAAPRGIAYDPASDSIHVACVGGELVSLPAAGGTPTRTLKIDRDLRDVVVHEDKLLVSRLRTAEVLVVGPEGKVWQRKAPPTIRKRSFSTGIENDFQPAVAWRMTAHPNGGAIMVHQRGMVGPVMTTRPGGYSGGGGCDEGIVETTITEVESGGEASPIEIPTTGKATLPGTALPVDVAISSSGKMVVVAAGTHSIVRTHIANIGPVEQQDPCAAPPTEPVPGQPVAAAFMPNGVPVVQLREPAALYLPESQRTIALPGESRRDTGHDVFHASPTGFGSIACASCHPDGGEDARTWNFDTVGLRRTQTIRGGIMDTAPLHWDGDAQTAGDIMNEVFVKRMGGTQRDPRRARLLSRWMDSIPKLEHDAPLDMAAVERGKTIYNDAKVACASCHSGPKLTNNQFADVGTGKPFQVPTLMGVADRAPYMHNGCAPTLRDSVTGDAVCSGGDKHGVTSHLTPDQLDDVVAYLETL